MTQAGDVSRAANKVEGQAIVQAGARVGYAVSGLLHLLIGWIAIQIAWFDSGKSADQSGALQTLAGNTVGRLTLWLAVVGFFALALWQLANAVATRPSDSDSGMVDRAKSAATAVLYLALGWTSFNTVKGRPRSSREQSADFTATLLQNTGGRLLVGVIGLVVIGIGAYHLSKGWTKKFLRDLRGHPGVLATRAGMIGYIAKGIALAVVGVLLLTAASQNSASRATGLDGALRSLREQAFGTWLLTLIGLGIAAYGVYSFARSRYARV